MALGGYTVKVKVCSSTRSCRHVHLHLHTWHCSCCMLRCSMQHSAYCQDFERSSLRAPPISRSPASGVSESEGAGATVRGMWA